jgi:D-aminopeptidase
MKVLIWFDMEGISGIDNPRACDFGSPLLQESREYATADVNAVIRGLKQGGATVIDIFDGHDFGGNLIADELDPHVNYLSGGWTDTLPELIRTRAFAEYNALVLVGHHSQSGTVNGFYSHTVSPDIALRLNSQPVGEIELAAWLAGYFGVRTIMVSSDEAGVNEARALLPEIETVSVKRRNILSGPIIVEILYKLTKLADNMALFPRYEKRNERTVVYKAEDFLEAFRAFTAFQAIMPEFIATFFKQMLKRVRRQVSVDIKALQSEVDAELESEFIPFPSINLAPQRPTNE